MSATQTSKGAPNEYMYTIVVAAPSRVKSYAYDEPFRYALTELESDEVRKSEKMSVVGTQNGPARS